MLLTNFYVNIVTMHFEPGNLYHIYNRGNNKQQIFFNRSNYLYFLEKVQKHIYPCCDILAWCLMPNHFHFLIHANDDTAKMIKETPLKINKLTEGIRLVLSSYAQGINKQENRVGNLFQQKTKYKNVTAGNENYGYNTFNYIHYNPCNAGLAKNLVDWEFCSFLDYAGLRNGKLCNIELAKRLFNLSERDFVSKNTSNMFPAEMLKNIL
jgi:putative transposase